MSRGISQFPYLKLTDNQLFSVTSSLILFVAGVVFFLFPRWFLIPVFGLAWLLYAFKVKAKTARLEAAVATGAFISLFDFGLENVGAQLGYWVSRNSIFFVLAVPIEILVGSFVAGMAWFLLYNPFRQDIKLILPTLILWSIGGTLGEYFLKLAGLMQYGNGWQSFPHAFLTYLISFLIFYKIATLGKNLCRKH